MKYNKTFIIAILALFLVQVCYAAEDFSAVSLYGEDLSVCAGSDAAADVISFVNTGDFTSTYIITSTGSAAEWSTFVPDSFILEPGEGKNVINYINSDNDARGKFDLTTEINTMYELTKVIKQKVEVKNCKNVDIIPKIWYNGGCPCTPLKFEYELVNTQNFYDDYYISVEPQAEWAAVSQKNLYLAGGQRQPIYVYVNAPCDLYGAYNLSLVVKTEKTSLTAKIPLVLDIEPCYYYSMSYGKYIKANETVNVTYEKDNVTQTKQEVQLVDKFKDVSTNSFTACERSTGTIPLKIQNDVVISNSYSFDLYAPEWAEISKDSTSLDGNEYGLNDITLNPPKGSAGNYSLIISALSDRGNLQGNSTLLLNVEECYNINLDITEETGIACSDETEEYKVLLKNDGIFKENINLSVDGPKWAKLSLDQLIGLDALTEFSFFLKVTPPKEIEEKSVAVIANLISQPHIGVKDDINIEVIPQEECRKVVVKPVKKVVQESDEFVQIELVNNGYKPADYVVTITSPEWIESKQELAMLDPSESKIIELKAKSEEWTEERDYVIQVEVQTNNDIVFYENVDIKLNKKSKILIFLKNYILYILLGLILLAVVIIILNRVREERENRRLEELEKKEKEKEAKKKERENKKIQAANAKKTKKKAKAKKKPKK